jgi:hypothetical protein
MQNEEKHWRASCRAAQQNDRDESHCFRKEVLSRQSERPLQDAKQRFDGQL